jgi:hypothetical protein
VDKTLFEECKARFDKGEYGFVLQHGHLTTDDFRYGISFIPKSYISSHWGKYFHIERCASAALHDWQDVIIVRPRKVQKQQTGHIKAHKMAD